MNKPKPELVYEWSDCASYIRKEFEYSDHEFYDKMVDMEMIRDNPAIISLDQEDVEEIGEVSEEAFNFGYRLLQEFGDNMEATFRVSW